MHELSDLGPDHGGQPPVLAVDGAAGTAGEDDPVEPRPEPLGRGGRVRAAPLPALTDLPVVTTLNSPG